MYIKLEMEGSGGWVEYFAFKEIISKQFGSLEISTTKEILGTLEALRAAGKQVIRKADPRV